MSNVLHIKKFGGKVAGMSALHEIGSAVRVRRTEMGLTQDLLARLSGLSRSTVYAVENQSIGNLSIAKAVALLESIGLSMNVNVSATGPSSRKKRAFEQIGDGARRGHGHGQR